MYEMKVSGEMIAVRLPDGSSGRLTGGIDGPYQGYRTVGPPEQRSTMELEHGTLALVLRHEVPARPTGEREGNTFDDGNDPFANRELVSVVREEDEEEDAEPPPWMQPGGGAPDEELGMGYPAQWGTGRGVVAHTIKLEVDGSKSTGIYAGASGEITVEAPNHKTSGYMVITTQQGKLVLDFLEWYEKGKLVADLWVNEKKSTGIYQNATGDLKFALGYYAAFEPEGALKDMCAKGEYSGTLSLEREPATA